MKPNIRWQILLAVVCLGLVLSLLSFQVQTASLCSTRVPAAGGTLVEGLVGAPRYLNPLLSDDNPVDRELVSLVFDGLTRYDDNGRLQPALAETWQVSEDGLTIRFELRDNLNWHDGEPVTAADVAFTYGLLQDEGFSGSPSLGALWRPITITTDGPDVVVFTLPEPYGPFLEATTRGILPAHRLEGVTGGTLHEAEFNQAPVGTGPFRVDSGSNWERTGRLRLTPNPDAWQPMPQIDALEYRFYPDADARLEAYRRGEIHAINDLLPTTLPDVAALPGLRLFTAPRQRYTQLLYNLTESGSPAVQTLEVRQALAYALDRDRLIGEALHGQGIPHEGPYLATSWAYEPAQLTLYETDPLTATALLDSSGWLLPATDSIRAQGEERLSLRLVFPDRPRYEALAALMAEQWAAVGVETELQPIDAETLPEILASRDFDLALVDIIPTGDPDLYDFWSQEAIVRGQNYAGWNNRRASEALEVGRQRHLVEERLPYYQTFLQLFNQDLPALTLYQHVYTYGLSEAVQEVEIGRIDHPRERYQTLSNWFLLYREVTVSCPPTGS